MSLTIVHGDKTFLVKLPPAAPLSQAKEAACAAFKLTAADFELQLTGKGKVLDEALTLRFAALPNAAQLQLVPRSKARAAQPIRIALQVCV